MALRAVKCSECGANIEIDGSAKRGVCPYCGAVYADENIQTKVENTYISNHNHIDRAILKNGETFDELYEKFIAYNKIGELDKAEKTVFKIRESFPHYGKTYIVTAEFYKNKISDLNDVFEKEREEWQSILESTEYQTASYAGNLLNQINAEFEKFTNEIKNADKLLSATEKKEYKDILRELKEFSEFEDSYITLLNCEFKNLYEKNENIKWKYKNKGKGILSAVCVGVLLLMLILLITLL